MMRYYVAIHDSLRVIHAYTVTLSHLSKCSATIIMIMIMIVFRVEAEKPVHPFNYIQ